MRNGKYNLVKAPQNFPGKKYRGKYCYEHQLVYWQNTGLTSKEKECIHHENGQTRDNTFSNLKLKDKGNHSGEHGKKKGITCVKVKCPQCGKIFEKKKRSTHLVKKKNKATFCSQKCSGKFFGLGKEITEHKQKMLDENIIDTYKVYA